MLTDKLKYCIRNLLSARYRWLNLVRVILGAIEGALPDNTAAFMRTPQ